MISIYLSNSVFEVRRVESLCEEPHVVAVVLVYFIRQLHQLQPDIHQSLVGDLILGALLGGERALLQVGIHHVHLQNLTILQN